MKYPYIDGRPMLPVRVGCDPLEIDFLRTHGLQPPSPRAGFALLDTGADRNFIFDSQAHGLLRLIRDRTVVLTADGLEHICPTYWGMVEFEGTGLAPVRGALVGMSGLPQLVVLGVHCLRAMRFQMHEDGFSLSRTR